MRLISTLFIICLFGKLINCNNNNDQSKATNDKQTQTVTNNQQTQPGPESRQISGGSMNHGYNYHENPSSSNNINIYTTDLKPNPHANPNAPLGYIKIQPMLANPFAHQSPEPQGSTTFLNFIKPDKHSSLSLSSRRVSLTNKLKNFMSSFFWKDSSNNASPYMMSSDSSYSYALQQPPFNFQATSQAQSPNYAPSGLASAASQYKPVVFGNYQQPDSNSYKYPNLFNSHYPNSNSQSNPQQHQQQQPQYYYNSAAASNPTYTYTAARNQNNFNSNQNSNHVGFPPSSFQVASASNVNSVYASTSNQYQPANQSNQNNQQELNSNQRSEVSAPSSSGLTSSASSSAGSSTNPGNSQLTSNTSNNPVSLIKTNNKQQFSSY